jgi:NitT/TauT family transport system substrate-binding protein
VEFKTEHSELVTLAAAGQMDLVVLPEPHVTTLLMQDAGFRVALDITEVFAHAASKAGNEEMVLSMGCWVVRRQFAQERPEAVQTFLRDYAESAEYVNAHVEESARWMEQFAILPKAAVAERALPNCHIVCIDGTPMRRQIEPLLGIWFAANPASVGGEMPGEDFYYAPRQ